MEIICLKTTWKKFVRCIYPHTWWEKKLTVSVLRWLEQQTSRHQTLTKSCIFRLYQELRRRQMTLTVLLACFLSVGEALSSVIWGTCYTITVHGLSEFALYVQFSWMVNKIRHSLEENITLLSVSCHLFGLALKSLT